MSTNVVQTSHMIANSKPPTGFVHRVDSAEIGTIFRLRKPRGSQARQAQA